MTLVLGAPAYLKAYLCPIDPDPSLNELLKSMMSPHCPDAYILFPILYFGLLFHTFCVACTMQYWLH